MTAAELSRRSMLARSSSVVAVAPAIAAPAVAQAAATPPTDATLVAMKTLYDDALEFAKASDERLNAAWVTVPSWTWRKPNAPLERPEFSDWSGQMSDLDLDEIYRGNNRAAERAKPENLEKVVGRCRARVRWLQAYQRKQKRVQRAAGVFDLSGPTRQRGIRSPRSVANSLPRLPRALRGC
jgi:hypothetical protein